MTRKPPTRAAQRAQQWLGAARRKLAALRVADGVRVRRVCAGRVAPRRDIEGRAVVSFSANDYLGLAGDARVAAAGRRGLDAYGVGAGSAFFVNGYTPAHRALEERLAETVRRDRAVLFPTGYMANLGMLSAFAGRGTALFQDRENHASLLDAAVLSRAVMRRYRRDDVGALERRLAAAPAPAVVVSESVFSMSGATAPLKTLSEVCAQHGSLLLVDEAHGFGVFGADGAGLCAETGLSQDEAPVLMATLGKSCGVFGAFVAGEEALVETVLQSARSYKYTTAPPAALACAALESLEVMRAEAWRREKLFENVARFREAAAAEGLPCMDSRTPIQAVLAGEASRALAWSKCLFRRGFEVAAMRAPTVPEGGERLRVVLSALHEEGDIKSLVEALAACCDGAPPTADALRRTK